MNICFISALHSKDNTRSDLVWVRAALLLVNSPQFFSMWRYEPNQIPNNLTGSSVQRPVTLMDDIDRLLQIPSCTPTDLF